MIMMWWSIHHNDMIIILCTSLYFVQALTLAWPSQGLVLPSPQHPSLIFHLFPGENLPDQNQSLIAKLNQWN